MKVRFLAALIFLILISAPAFAHGFLVRAVPEDRAVLERSPMRVQYWFSEGLEPAFSTVTVRDVDGNVIAEGGADEQNAALLSAQLPSNLPDGAYIADLRLAFASDGHVITETRVFFVGAEVAGISGGVDAQADTVEVVWRGLTLTGLILAFGTATLYSRVLLPAWGSAAHQAGGLPLRVMQRLTLVMGVALGLAIIAQIAALLQQTSAFFGVGVGTVLSQSLWSVVRMSTRFGEVWNARMMILVVVSAMIATGWFYRRTQPELTRPMWSAAWWGLAIALGASSVITHAAGSRTTPWVALIVDWTHMLAVAIWVGGLASLALTLPAALRTLDAEESRKALLAALRQFSPIAAACLLIVVATGIFSASLWLRPIDLITTDYGFTLLVKLAMAAGLIAVGAAHRAALDPERWARWSDWIARLGGWRRTLRLEAVFGVLTLIGAAWLTATPVPVPPDAAQPIPAINQVQKVDGYTVDLTVSPGGPGANTFDLTVTQGGAAVNDFDTAMQTIQPARDVRSAWQPMEPLDGGTYSTVNPDLDRAGTWWALVDLVSADGARLRAAFVLNVREDAAIDQTVRLTALQAFALMLTIAAVGYAAYPSAHWVYRRLDLSPQAVTVAVIATAGVIAVLAGGTLFLAQNAERYEAAVNPPPQIVNPVLPDAESLARGGALFDDACPGWTPESRGWNDLKIRMPRTRDEELFGFTRDGYRGLPACDSLTDTQRWDVVNFIRDLFNR